MKDSLTVTFYVFAKYQMLSVHFLSLSRKRVLCQNLPRNYLSAGGRDGDAEQDTHGQNKWKRRRREELTGNYADIRWSCICVSTA